MALEVHLESAAGGGLKVIEDIPGIRPCRLEGRNGIGKSALIRLLRLVSGQQPYATEPAAWQSLRRLVGPTVITVSGLEGPASSATVRLTPERWPEDPKDEIGDWLGELTLGGADAPVEDLFKLFHVIHLSGTERLADTLTQHQTRLHVDLADTMGRLEDLYEQRADLGEVLAILVDVSPRQATLEHERLLRAADERRRLSEQLSTVQPRMEDLGRASLFQTLLDGGSVAEDESRLKSLREDLQKARDRAAAAESAHEAAIADLARGSKAQREVAKRERKLNTVERNLDRLLTRHTELASLLESLGLPPEAEELDTDQRAVLAKARTAAATQHRRLQVAAARSQRSGDENRLLDDVRVVLDDGLHAGLGDMVLAYVHDMNVTVHDLAGGLGYVADLDVQDAGELAAAASALVELDELVELYERRTALTTERDLLRRQLAEFESEAGDHDELRDAATRAREGFDEATAQVRSLNMQIGALSRSALGGADVDDVETHVDELLSSHGVSPEDLHTELNSAQTTVTTLQQRLEELEREVDELTRNETRRRLDRDALRRDSETKPHRRWLKDLAHKVATRPDELDTTDWPDEVWQHLADHVGAVRSTLDQLVNDISGLGALTGRGSKPRSGAEPLDAAVRAVIEAEGLRELSARPIAEALFDGGTLERVSLDGAETVTWRTPDGDRRTRPLSAFSSGMQALGFMRARLQQIADQPQANRLIFLDEFGAFISADQRRPLAELLISDDLQALSDQVVVVLPLQADYEAELDETTGELHDLYAERVEQIRRRGYFTEDFNG